MLLALQNAFLNLLQTSFAELFGGADPPVKLTFPRHAWTMDPSSADPTAGEPTPDDAVDLLAFDPAHPEGPYSLSRPPYPGPRRVYLRTPENDRQSLGPAEVQWDSADPQSFTLQPRPVRPLSGFDRVEVLYGVTAVFTQLKTHHEMPVLMTASKGADVERAEALALAAFALNREAVMTAGSFSHTGGGYTAVGKIKNLKLRQGAANAEPTRELVLDAEVELKASRALAEGEGRAILRILSPGKAPSQDRKVDIEIDVQS